MKNATTTPRSIQNYRDYVRDIRKFVPLSDVQTALLFQAYQVNGDTTARKTLFEHNLLFVVTVARKLFREGMDVMDLIANGNLGLNEAIEHYDATRGMAFTSYAFGWIRKYVLSAISQYHNIMHISERDIKNQGDINKYLAACDFIPTAQDVADALHLTRQTVVLMSQYGKPVSLDAPLNDEEDEERTFSDTLTSDQSTWADYDLMDAEYHSQFSSCIDMLPAKEAQVVRMLYGFDGFNTLDDVADAMHISTERVRQLHNKAKADLPKIISSYKMVA